MIKKLLHSKLIKDSFIYVFADVINKAIPFLLLPVLTYYLTPADYGKLASFNSFFGLMGIFIGLSIQGAISVNYYKMKKEELASFVGNVIYILLSSLLLTLIIVTIFQHQITNYIGLEIKWLYIAAVMSFFSFIVLMNLSLWLVEQKPLFYGGFELFDTLIKLGFSLFFVISLLMTWRGRVLGMFIGAMLSAIISLILLYKRGYLKFGLKEIYIKDALHFGIPLVPHQLSFWLRTGAIILLLNNFVGKDNTGLYSVGLQFVIPLSVLTVAFNKAWAPYLYRKLSDNPNIGDKNNIVKFTYSYIIAITLLSLLLIWIAPMVIKLLLNKDFHGASLFIKYLTIGVAFQGMYYMVVNYIFYVKKTKYLAYITFGTSLVNVSLAYVLIQKNGALGAAQANAISMFLSFLLVWYYSNKVYPMPWILIK